MPSMYQNVIKHTARVAEITRPRCHTTRWFFHDPSFSADYFLSIASRWFRRLRLVSRRIGFVKSPARRSHYVYQFSGKERSAKPMKTFKARSCRSNAPLLLYLKVEFITLFIRQNANRMRFKMYTGRRFGGDGREMKAQRRAVCDVERHCSLILG